jgi:CRISPR-associated protein (TIGR03986 family)
MGNRRGRNQGRGGGGKNRRQHHVAWAPYNFVPMPDKPVYAELDQQGIPQPHCVYDSQRHTGYFDVQLTTETPLFIRGMLKVGETEGEEKLGDEMRNNDRAFSIDGTRPAIPGSSLRGMLRTIVEIITYSKMHFVGDTKLVYRSVFGNDSLARDYRSMVVDEIGSKHFRYPTQLMHGGYLQRGTSQSGWVIQPAKEHEGQSFVLVDTDAIERIGISTSNYQKTHQVYVLPVARTTHHSGRERGHDRGLRLEVAKTSDINKQPATGYESATLVISGEAPQRHWYGAIYNPSDEAKPIPISQQMWDDYKVDSEMQRGIETRKIREGDALYYLLDESGRLIFWGPTMFFRMPYRFSIGQMMKPSLRKSNPNIDYAEAMFGYVSEQDETREPTAYAGRISVTSAFVAEELDNYYDDTIVPRILGSPKPTTFQHYLEQPNGEQTPTHQLRHYGDDTKIRGHKLYWRRMIESLAPVKEPDNSKTPETSTQHTRIKPVCKGVRFKFRVYFENLSDIELGALIWAINLGKDPDARHQLGMGKPLGLGVVKLEPTLTLTLRQERYSKLFNEDGTWFEGTTKPADDEAAACVNAFKQKMGNFDNAERIQELKTLLRMQNPDGSRAIYMKIENNDYDGRPVLPYPSQVDR